MGGTMIDLRRDLAEARSILRARDGELKRMKQALDEFRGRRAAKTPARQPSALKAKLESLQKELGEEKRLKEQAQEELVLVKAICDNAQEENTVLKEQVHNLRQELQASETALVKSFITVTEKDAEIDDLKRELVEESSAQGNGDWTLKVTQSEVQDRANAVDSEEPHQARNPGMCTQEIVQEMLGLLLDEDDQDDQQFPQDAFECNVQREVQERFRAAFETAFTTAFESAFDPGSEAEPLNDSESDVYNSDQENDAMDLYEKLQLFERFREEDSFGSGS